METNSSITICRLFSLTSQLFHDNPKLKQINTHHSNNIHFPRKSSLAVLPRFLI